MIPVDLHLLGQTIFYFVSVITGLITCISTGMTNINFGFNCILYGHVKWQNATSFDVSFGSMSTCSFVVYINVAACVCFAFGMGCYYGYATYRSRVDPAVGFQMWSLAFILSTSVTLFLCLVAACILSVGFATWCSSITSGRNYGANITSCSDGQTLSWNHFNGTSYDGSNYYNALTSAQIASWICFFVWIIQVTLTVIRWYRNKYEITRTSTYNDEQDNTQFARAHPTA